MISDFFHIKHKAMREMLEGYSWRQELIGRNYTASTLVVTILCDIIIKKNIYRYFEH